MNRTAARLVHDCRNAHQAVQGYIELLQDEVSPIKRRKFVEEALIDLRRAEKIVTQLESLFQAAEEAR